MNWTIRHCITPNGTDEELIEKVHEFCHTEITPDVTPLWENYQPERLDIRNHLIFSVIMQNNEISTMGGIYNGGRYPAGVYRILNRSFINPKFRVPNPPTIPGKWRPIVITDEQIKLVRENLDLIFISFDPHKRRHRPELVTRQIVQTEPSQWHFPKELYKVAPGNGPGSFQKICWYPFSLKYTEPPLEEFTEAGPGDAK